MLSSILLKKKLSLFAFTLVASVFLHMQAYALIKLVFVDEKSNEVEMNVDRDGNVHLINPPIAGDFYYKQKTQEFIFQLEGMTRFYRLPVSTMRVKNMEFRVVESDDVRISDTSLWDMKLGKEVCGLVKGSASMVKDVQVTIKDLSSINNAFAYILGHDLKANPCLNYGVSQAVAEKIGFPIYLSTNHGTTLLKEESLLQYGGRVIMPKGAVLLTDEALFDVYMSQIPEAAKDLYKTLKGGKSSNIKFRLDALREAVRMVRSGKWHAPRDDLFESNWDAKGTPIATEAADADAASSPPAEPTSTFVGFDGRN